MDKRERWKQDKNTNKIQISLSSVSFWQRSAQRQILKCLAHKRRTQFAQILQDQDVMHYFEGVAVEVLVHSVPQAKITWLGPDRICWLFFCIFCADFRGKSAEVCGMDLNMIKCVQQKWKYKTSIGNQTSQDLRYLLKLVDGGCVEFYDYAWT